MPRTKKYPQWVQDLRPKGHTVKEKNGNYYLYKTTSKYRAGKSPLPQSTYVGRITPDGIVYSSKKRVDVAEHPKWYEYGFSHAFYKSAFPIVKRTYGDDTVTRQIVLSIIREYSPKSYLLKGVELPEKMNVCLSNQEARITKAIGKSMEELLTLKDILIIEMPKSSIITAITPEEETILNDLEVTLDA